MKVLTGRDRENPASRPEPRGRDQRENGCDEQNTSGAAPGATQAIFGDRSVKTETQTATKGTTPATVPHPVSSPANRSLRRPPAASPLEVRYNAPAIPNKATFSER